LPTDHGARGGVRGQRDQGMRLAHVAGVARASRLFVGLGGLLLTLFSQVAPAAAQEVGGRRAGPAHRLKLDLDLPIVLIAGATVSSFFFLPEAPGVVCAPKCDRHQINRFDRIAAGNYDRSWTTVGDIATASTMALPFIVLVADEGFRDGLNDDLVVAEAALVTSAAQVSLSFAVERPRPRVYSERAPLDQRDDANAARSFFSGHVANTMATSVAALRTLQRLRQPVLAWTTFGVGFAGTSLVGVSRVLSGSHFPSDVLIGAAFGAGVGLALPALHDRPLRVEPLASADEGGVLVSGVF
jgi:membrane-associated phospholipid phosphatase